MSNFYLQVYKQMFLLARETYLDGKVTIGKSRAAVHTVQVECIALTALRQVV